ncbi:MAG: hypothetical protein IBX39_08095 [Candidatus Methanoperedenaceae archaeon]|nr:hypothetical protein [Candidatus Methanoperedenaceae archaeon]
MNGNQQEELFGKTIYEYSREQALRDGVLVDVTETAKEAGIKYPVAVTEALWNYIEPTKKLIEMGQSVQGRLWDVLYLFTIAGRSVPKGCAKLLYNVSFLMENSESFKTHVVKLKAVCGPGDTMEPVITLMLENED